MTKIDAFAHILPPSYAERLESITSGDSVSDRILGYQPWIREDSALIDLDARWRSMDPFGDYRQILTLAVPPLEEPGGPERCGSTRLAARSGRITRPRVARNTASGGRSAGRMRPRLPWRGWCTR